MQTRRQESEVRRSKMPSAERRAAAIGMVALPERREEAVAKHAFYRIRAGFYRIITGFYRLWIGFSRLFPHLPGSSRIKFFCGQPKLGSNMGRGEPPRHKGTEVSGGRSQEERSDAELRGRKCRFLRIFPRFSTILRTDQGRGYAILRIFTGETNFLITKPGNEENRHGQAKLGTKVGEL